MCFRLLFLGLLLPAFVQAQTVVTPLESSWQLSAPAASATSANEVVLRQAGVGNQAMLSVLAGSQNRLEVNQNAVGNSVTVQVTGHANGVQLNQTGSNNRLELDLKGNSNALKISQDGGDVARLSGLTGSNTGLELIQRNGSNTLLSEGPLSTGTGAANLRIEQSGGATVRIQNGRTF